MKTRKLSDKTPILEQDETAVSTEDGTAELDQQASLDAAQDATATNISPELQKDGQFRKKIVKHFQKGSPTITYGEKIYELTRTSDGSCSVKELTIGINSKFKMYSDALGKKVWEMTTTPKGILARPLASAGAGGADGVASLSTSDSDIGTGKLHEIYPLLNKDGGDTGAIRVKGKSHNGNLTSSNGFDEFIILNSVCKKNKIQGRKIVREYLVDSSTINTACRSIWNAMDGWGTDEDKIISQLTRLKNTENSAGNWMMMLYGWDNNDFGESPAVKINDIPQDIQDVMSASGAMGRGFMNILTLGQFGMVTQALKDNIGFRKNTPMYTSSDDTDLESGYRGLLMDICDENEDSWKKDQVKVGNLLKELTNNLPSDDFCWRLVDSASGEVLVSSGDSGFMEKYPKKAWMKTAKTFKTKYLSILGDLLGDDDWEGHDG